jgi:DNA invertase Pin-like site-specific DNA recombinase
MTKIGYARLGTTRGVQSPLVDHDVDQGAVDGERDQLRACVDQLRSGDKLMLYAGDRYHVIVADIAAPPARMEVPPWR